MATPPGPPRDPGDPRYGRPPGSGGPQGPPPGYPPQGPPGTPPWGQPQHGPPGTPPWGQPPQGPPRTPPSGYPQQDPPPAGYPQQGYGRQGYPQQAYPQQAYPQPGYGQPGYGQQPYPPYPGGGFGPGVPPAGDPLVPADLGGWFRRIVGVVQRSLVPLLQIQLAVAVLSVLVTLLLGGAMTTITPADVGGEFSSTIEGTAVLGAVILAVVGAYALAASVFIAVTQASGEPVNLGTALSFAARRVLPLIGWGIVAGLLIGIGIVALILPGLYLAVVFAASLVGVVVIERRGIGRCFKLVNNRFGPTLGRMLLVFLVAIVFAGIQGFLAASLGPDSLVGAIVQALLGIVSGIVAVGVYVVTYAELRFHDRERPGALTPALAAELRR
jgi:uncharacterized membrane protein (DUF485 family)